MVFKVASIGQAPDGDPEKHRSSLKTSTMELTEIFIKLGDIDRAVAIAKDLVEKEGIQAITLCPGFSNIDVAKVAEAVRGRAAVGVTRFDGEGTGLLHPILEKEGFIAKQL